MADVLSQIQLELDRLSNQFTASVNYISTHAPCPPIVPQPNTQSLGSPPANSASADPSTQSQSQAPNTQNQNSAPPAATDPSAAAATEPIPRSVSPMTFAAEQKELAEDLMKKTAQIVELIDTLPGLKRSPASQEARIAELEEELKAMEIERRDALGVRERAIDVLERVISGVRR